ncbi:hypothetical protein D9757_013696 [Collybiopsis confluens]|uniref:CDF zinc transporter n=1 Tax=Collybiopsis confluens TaxID=2823264 RepID=A0A8H5LSK4_9AGAR|nr:hypothetical protein D9757_013696 [Collybiopsis confluens]
MKSTSKLAIVLAISASFFIAEISIGFKTKSIALIADAFHYLNSVFNDSVSLRQLIFEISIIAFVASYAQNRGQTKKGFTYAFQRAELLGAFFNGVFLLALALSIFLQSLERFISIEPVQSPKDVLIVGCTGLALNVLSVLFVHDHAGHSHGQDDFSNLNAIELPDEIKLVHSSHHHARTSPAMTKKSHNLGMLAVLIHLCGDAVNNIGVIVAAVLIWKLDSPNRFYADPTVSMLISFVIFASALPLTARTGRILLEAAPKNLDMQKINDDLNGHPNVLSIHDLHVWHLSQNVISASVHVCVPPETSFQKWEKTEQSLQHCFSEYGVDHVTIAPEVHDSTRPLDGRTATATAISEEGGETRDDELLGTCKMPSKDGFGCVIGEHPNMTARRRETGHAHV